MQGAWFKTSQTTWKEAQTRSQWHHHTFARAVSRWHPFPPSKSSATRPLDLIHSDLDEFPVHSIGGYKWTVTYLDDHSSYGVMFYLKSKDEEFTTFKSYKTWAERQLGTILKCKQTDQGGEFLSNEQEQYLKRNGIEHQMSVPDLPQQNGSETMWHHAGLWWFLGTCCEVKIHI